MTDTRRTPCTAVAVALLMALAGCSGGKAPASADVPTEAESPLELGTFRGDLPCADCPGIRHTLELLPDNRYVLRREYLERGTTIEEAGHWSVDPARDVLELDAGDADRVLQWQIETSDRLELLDLEGNPITSGLDYTLTRDP